MIAADTLPMRHPDRAPWLHAAIIAAQPDSELTLEDVDRAIEIGCDSVKHAHGFWPDSERDEIWSHLIEAPTLNHLDLDYDDIFPVTVEPRAWAKWAA
ncbi:MAG: hypothetical protein K0S37_782 [Microbacterium sp.]|jgi:hypothetical protein|nr:hypothetical protein [Microbacterium sp.]